MRLRRKPWARPELAACDFYVDDPTQLRNRWQEEFANDHPLVLELGCGKGGFLAVQAAAHPELNFIGVDLKSEVLVLAKRKAEEMLQPLGRTPGENLRLMSQDIERLGMILGEKDRISRIYINFCNPWPKPRHAKHRLTHTRQLLLYRQFLKPEGQLWFKTDDDPLFEDTLLYLEEAGWQVQYLTRDLLGSGFEENVPTEHEEMFSAQGIPIKFLIAVQRTEAGDGAVMKDAPTEGADMD
ncbi:tRNA (guanosine(46)-N7)-methyltransferase TrmB [Angelakisella massiliensis]|uniref:tRNA (guanosine(46)-N7)-methyltransferase TrmB n=1 Tax=Angelakisella massiliensis TaxID=1871018 RepID=UPI0008F92ECC|nr:tRNA (guanosine(46)-N7)-methyltransferase TrmB [Angelakisella massiliensis]